MDKTKSSLGEEDNGWRLSPLYDVNPVPYGDELSLNVDEENNSISIDLAIQTAVRFGIHENDARNYVEDMTKMYEIPGAGKNDKEVENTVSAGAVAVFSFLFDKQCYNRNVCDQQGRKSVK